MKGRKRGILISLIVIAVVAFCLWVFQPREPEYEGRKLSEWLIDFESPKMSLADTHTQASAAIKAMGTNAIPFLLKDIQSKRSLKESIDQRLSEIDFDPSWVGMNVPFEETAYAKHEHAIGAFAALNTNADCAIPRLVSLLDTPTGQSAGRALLAIGKNGVITLVNHYPTANIQEKASIAASMQWPDTTPEIALPILRQAINDPSDLVKLVTIDSLLSFRLHSKEAVDLLKGVQKNSDPLVKTMLDERLSDLNFKLE